MHVLDVTRSTKYDNNFLDQLKSRIKGTIKWNKYRSEMTNQTKTNHLNNLIDSSFTKIIFVLSFENERIEHLFQSIMYQTLK